MRFAIDIVSITYLTIITIVKMLCYFFNANHYVWVILISLAGSIMATLIKHNHCHLSTFRNRWINYFMDMWLNLLTGTSCSSVKIIHNINHHTYINEAHKDWASTHPFEYKGRIRGFITYVLLTPFSFIKAKQRWLNDHKNSTISRYNKIENTFIFITLVLFCMVNLEAGIYVFIIPAILLQFSLAVMNYLQHFNNEDNPNKSNDISFKWLNWLFFNVGYHTEHHNQPNKHWSLLGKKQRNS